MPTCSPCRGVIINQGGVIINQGGVIINQGGVIIFFWFRKKVAHFAYGKFCMRYGELKQTVFYVRSELKKGKFPPAF
jgi:hypothetical protein